MWISYCEAAKHEANLNSFFFGGLAEWFISNEVRNKLCFLSGARKTKLMAQVLSAIGGSSFRRD